jgi:DNA helicase-2/ATP-dependent DNA helicase PcrA
VAEQVISANRQRKEKRLWTENDIGIPINIAEAYTEQEEAHFVVNEIENLVGQGLFRLADCAVMYRTNAQSRAIEEAFVRYGIPYKLVGGVRFYERREVRDIIAYLKLVHNPYDSVSLARVINLPPRGIGARTIEELSRWAKERSLPVYAALQTVADENQETPFNPRTARALTNFLAMLNQLIAKSAELDVVELLDLVVKSSGYREHILEAPDGEDRWDNILELRTVAAEYRHLAPQEGLSYFLEGVTLASDVDSYDEKVDAVTLITLHAAKGLEFPVVFISGLEEGLLPHRKAMDDPDQLEEERRLCYVGITRARERLYLVRAFRRSYHGSTEPGLPSRFLLDISPHLATSPPQPGWEGPVSMPPSPVTVPPTPSTQSLKAGDHVHHAAFGEGIVVSCLSIKDDHEVTVAFKGKVGLKRLLLSLAPLEKLP